MKLLPCKPTRAMVRSAISAARARYPESSRIPMKRNSNSTCGRNTSTLPTPFQTPSTIREVGKDGGRVAAIHLPLMAMAIWAALERGRAAMKMVRMTPTTTSRKSSGPATGCRKTASRRRGHFGREDRRGQHEMACQIGGIQNQQDGFRLGGAGAGAVKHVVGHLLVFGARVEAVDAGEVHDADGAAIGEFGDSGVLLHRDTGEIGHLLAQSGETIEEGGLAGIGRPHQRHRADRRRARQFRYRRITTTMATAAIAHAILGVLRGLSGSSGLACLSGRTFKRHAVSRRRAISEPSTWKTRGSPPGALFPAVMRVPGTKPSSIRRRASSVGISIRSRMAASPFRRSTRLASSASGDFLLPLSCNMVLVCARPKFLSSGRTSLPRVFFAMAPQCPPSAPN